MPFATVAGQAMQQDGQEPVFGAIGKADECVAVSLNKDMHCKMY